MKIKWYWLPVALVIVLVVLAIGVRVWLNSSGIRILGNDIHMNLTQKCFIIDGQTGEMLDETTISVNGGTSRTDRELFDGEMKILGYQNSVSGTVMETKVIEINDDGPWTITYLETCTHQETDVDGITKDVEHICDYSYTYYVYPNAPEQLVVLIETFDSYNPMYAVCAESEEIALLRYEEFMKERS